MSSWMDKGGLRLSAAVFALAAIPAIYYLDAPWRLFAPVPVLILGALSGVVTGLAAGLWSSGLLFLIDHLFPARSVSVETALVSIAYLIVGSVLGTLLGNTGRRTRDLACDEAFSDTIIETVGAPVVVLDLAGNVVRINAALEELAGRRREEVLGENFVSTFVPCEDTERVAEAFRHWREGDYPARFRNRIVDAAGRQRLIQWHNTVIADGDGAFSHMIAAGIDVTDLKRAHDRARESELRLLRITNNMYDVIFESDQSNVIRYVSPSVKATLGYDPEQLMGEHSLARVHPEDRPGLDRNYDRFLGGLDTAASTAEFRVRHADGHYLWMESFASRVRDESGEIIGAIFVRRDITTRKMAEREIENSLSLLRATLEATADGILVVGIDGSIRGYNERYREMWELPERLLEKGSADELLVYVMELLHDPEDFAEEVRRLREQPEEITRDTLYFRDGRVFDRYSMPQKLGGKTVGRVWSFRDVTETHKTAEALRWSERRLRRITENARDLIAELDTEANFTYVTPSFHRVLGYEPSDLRGRNLWEFVHPGDADHLRENLIEGDPPETLEVRYRRSDDIYLSLEISLRRPEGTESGYGWIMVGRDVTQRRRAERELALSEARFRLLAENARDLIFRMRLHPELDFEYVSPSATAIVGYSPEEHYADPGLGLRLVHPADRDKFESVVSGHHDFDKPLELRWISSDGRIVWVEQQIVGIHDDDGRLVALEGIARDITERRRLEEEIRHLSFHDGLTGLYNRAFFEAELARLDVDRNLPISLLMADLDGLKLINDAFGHEAGDDFLKAAAEILRIHLRADDILARWGGDEFAAVLPGTDGEQAGEIADRLSAAFDAADLAPVAVSVSLGIGTKRDSMTDVGDVLRLAEERMYRSKLRRSRSLRHALISSLRNSLKETEVETQEHLQRVEDLALKLGRHMGLSPDRLDELALLAGLHDIGKIALNTDLLLKSGPLDKEEWERVQRHPETGYRIAQSSPDLAIIAEGILGHHERWDGGGYPQGISGEEIPLTARIVAVADAYDIMTSGRPYREAISREKALAEIERCSGTQFDPKVAHLFTQLMRRS